jgi:hypothetical protein
MVLLKLSVFTPFYDVGTRARVTLNLFENVASNMAQNLTEYIALISVYDLVQRTVLVLEFAVLSKIHFNIIHPLQLCLPSGLFPSDFTTKTTFALLPPPSPCVLHAIPIASLTSAF